MQCIVKQTNHLRTFQSLVVVKITTTCKKQVVMGL